MSKVTIGPKGAGKINSIAETKGEQFANENVTTSQIRQIYAEIKRAETQYRSQEATTRARGTLLLLKPKLAYAASRQEEMAVVEQFISTCIDKYVNPQVDDVKLSDDDIDLADDESDDRNMDVFFELMEAIIAYHHYYTEVEGT